MAKNPTDFAQQNTERAVQATNYGMNWMREIAEQNLNQSKAALEGLLMITRKLNGGEHVGKKTVKSDADLPPVATGQPR
jgi:hypothetical protein